MVQERALRRTGKFGIGGVIIGLGLMALMAALVFIGVSAQRDRALRTNAVTSAASSLAASTQAALD